MEGSRGEGWQTQRDGRWWSGTWAPGEPEEGTGARDRLADFLLTHGPFGDGSHPGPWVRRRGISSFEHVGRTDLGPDESNPVRAVTGRDKGGCRYRQSFHHPAKVIRRVAAEDRGGVAVANGGKVGGGSPGVVFRVVQSVRLLAHVCQVRLLIVIWVAMTQTGYFLPFASASEAACWKARRTSLASLLGKFARCTMRT